MNLKHLLTTLTACVALGLSACSGTSSPSSSPEASSPAAQSPSQAAEAKPTLTKEGELLTAKDPEAKVFDGSGLRVSIDPAAKTAHIHLIDPNSGEDFKDYYEFNYAEGIMLSHRFVSMRQTEYDYTVKLDSGELVSVVDAEGNDAVPTLKQMGRFEPAQADRVKERGQIEQWFQERFGTSLEEATTR